MGEEKVYWDEILKLFASVTVAAMVVPIIVALMFRRYWNRALLVAFWYYLATFLLSSLEQFIFWACPRYREACVQILEYWDINNTFFLSILFFTKDYILLGWFFKLIVPVKRIGNIIKWCSIIFVIASWINHCFIEGYKGFGIFNSGINAIYMVSLPLLYLWYSQKESLRIPLHKNPYFWISIGLLIPSLLTLFLYFSGNYILESDYKLYSILKSIENGFAIIGLVLVCIGFTRSRFARFISTEEVSDAVEYDSTY